MKPRRLIAACLRFDRPWQPRRHPDPMAGRLGASLAALALCWACASDPDAKEPKPEPEVVTCVLGQRVGADFVGLAAPATAELVLGFQGFVWVELWVRADRAPGDGIAKVKYAYAIEGLQPASAAMTTRFEGDEAALRLLLSPADVGQLADRDVELSIRIEVAGLRCDASHALTLRDLDACIHVDDARGCVAGGKP